MNRSEPWAVIARHSRSFSLAARVLPPVARYRAAVIYTYCRRVDDAVDHAPPGGAGAALDRLRAEIERIYAGVPQGDPALAAFQDVAMRCRIPRDYPAELLAGMDMDVRDTRYHDMDGLLLYCHRVAGTVGLMMSHVMGLVDQAALREATHLGIAMQLTNICRDVLDDWHMGRLYVPDDLLAAYGAAGLHTALGGPFPASARLPMAAAVRRLLAEAERYYASGDRGLPSLPWRAAFAVRVARLVYSSIGSRIARAHHDVMAGRAVVPDLVKLGLVGRAALHVMAEIPRRSCARLITRRRAVIPTRIIRFPRDVLPL